MNTSGFGETMSSLIFDPLHFTLKNQSDSTDANAYNGALNQVVTFNSNGLKGRDGNDGRDGRDGNDGQPGARGPRGIQGEPGSAVVVSDDGTVVTVTGPQGEPGTDGTDGADGANGTDGTDGAPGERGPQGEPGPPGANGADGAPGAAAVVSADGTVVTITGPAGLGYAGLTSTSSVEIALGPCTFTTNLDATATAFSVGARIRAYNALNDMFMDGIITSFLNTTLIVNVTNFSGAGQFSPWTFSVVGTAGLNGDPGADGATGIGYAGLTSDSALEIGTGTKTFTTNLDATASAFIAGTSIRAFHVDVSRCIMDGIIRRFEDNRLTIQVDFTEGSGTFSSWTFSVNGERGAAGAPGAAGADSTVPGPPGPPGSSASQVQSDWLETNPLATSFIKNKQEIDLEALDSLKNLCIGAVAEATIALAAIAAAGIKSAAATSEAVVATTSAYTAVASSEIATTACTSETAVCTAATAQAVTTTASAGLAITACGAATAAAIAAAALPGTAGPAGAKGDKGDTGDTGSTGNSGPRGYSGDDGKGYDNVTSGDNFTIVNTGSKQFMTNQINAYGVGTRVRVASSSTPTSWVEGVITASQYYSDFVGDYGLISVAIDASNGVGQTYSSWNFSVVGQPGIPGPKGDTGAQGTPGAKGDKGDPGSAGPAGTDYTNYVAKAGDTMTGALVVGADINSGGSVINAKNVNAGSLAYSVMQWQTDTGSAYIFKNSSTRTQDGGFKTCTFRNDDGDLRLSALGDNPSIYLKSSTGVGIGTIAPKFLLNVAADIAVSSDIADSSAQFAIMGKTTHTKRMVLGYDTETGGNGYGFIKAGNYGVAWTNVVLQPSGGNVGIGITNPTAKLDIRGGSISLGSWNTASGSRYVGLYNVNDTNGCVAGMEIENTTLGGSYSQKLHFRTHHYGVSEGRRLTIAENGNVGIGTETPGYKLTVAGDILASGGWVRVAGNAGLYCESWGGGWYMVDADYIRSYNNKQVWAANYFYTDTGYKVLGTVVIDSSRNLTNIGSITATGNARITGSIILAGNGAYEAGCIYTDSNWGMLFRAKQANPAIAEFNWRKSDGTEIMRLLSDRIQLNSFTQPKTTGGSFAGVSSFNTSDFNLDIFSDFTSVEIRLTLECSGTYGGLVSLAFLDNGGYIRYPNEATTFLSGKQNWSNNTATLFPYVETRTAGNSYGAVIRIYRSSTSTGRFHYESTGVGCYAGSGATTARSQGYVVPNTGLSYIKNATISTNVGFMYGTFSVTQYI